MPDITLCKGGDCPRKTMCFRHIAPPSEYRQSYFVEPPGVWHTPEEFECRHFWPAYKKDEA